jgi:hypothetical protein
MTSSIRRRPAARPASSAITCRSRTLSPPIKNQKAAKDFHRWFQSTEVYDTWFTSQQGFSVGATKAWENHKFWNADLVMAPFRTAAESGRFAGYAGRGAAETISKFIIVDMYAKAVQGMAAEEAVRRAQTARRCHNASKSSLRFRFSGCMVVRSDRTSPVCSSHGADSEADTARHIGMTNLGK